MKIYTKNGDQGQTQLFGGGEVPKNSPAMDAIGSVDELNSLLGVLIAELKEFSLYIKDKHELLELLEREQRNLIRLGADLATPLTTAPEISNKINRIQSADTAQLEQEIDKWQGQLPELKNFILPGGKMPASLAHHSRSVCRRAERDVYTLSQSTELSQAILPYLNRFSDWLFVLARYINHLSGEDDIIA